MIQTFFLTKFESVKDPNPVSEADNTTSNESDFEILSIALIFTSVESSERTLNAGLPVKIICPVTA